MEKGSCRKSQASVEKKRDKNNIKGKRKNKNKAEATGATKHTAEFWRTLIWW